MEIVNVIKKSKFFVYKKQMNGFFCLGEREIVLERKKGYFFGL